MTITGYPNTINTWAHLCIVRDIDDDSISYYVDSELKGR